MGIRSLISAVPLHMYGHEAVRAARLDRKDLLVQGVHLCWELEEPKGPNAMRESGPLRADHSNESTQSFLMVQERASAVLSMRVKRPTVSSGTTVAGFGGSRTARSSVQRGLT